MKNLRTLLIELLNIHAVSGEEKPVRDYLEKHLVDTMDSLIIDDYGNLLGTLTVGTGEGATILLSAHMDTVEGTDENKVVKENDGIFTASLPSGERTILGADDRAGIAIILNVLDNIPKGFNGTIKLAFSREEEIGCVGAKKIHPKFLKDVDLAIVVDRRGSRDIVIGSFQAFCSDTVGNFMEHTADVADMDWLCVEGGISDAMTFSNMGVNSINLSAGYEYEHTSSEYVSIHHMKDTVKLIVQTLALVNGFFPNFGEVPDMNKWIKKNTNFLNDDGTMFDYADDVSAYEEDDNIIIRQGIDEICMSKDAFQNIYRKMFYKDVV